MSNSATVVEEDTAAINGLVHEQQPRPQGLSDLVDLYAVAEYMPPADWVTRLSLERPRRDLRCLGPITRFWKRSLDVFVSIVMLIVLAPVMLGVALMVRLTSPGPIIFRQQRVGLNLRGKQ